MATIYSAEYSNAAITNNISYRVKIDYTTSLSGSSVTASGTVSLQAKGTFSGSVSSTYKYVKGIVKLSSIAPGGSGVAWGDTVGETANQTRTATSYSSWTTLKSASFSGSEIRLSSDRTVYIYGAIQFIDADATTSRGLYGIGPYGSILVPAQETYTITYRANGGASGDFTETYSSAYSYFISSRTGYRDNAAFVAWNTAADGTGTSYLPYASFTTSSDVTLYAIWVAVPQITDISAIRSDSSGNPDDEGSYALLSATWNIDSTIDPNASASVTGTCTPQGGSSSSVTLTGDTSGTGGTAEALVPNMDTNQQYSFTITVANGQKCSGALLVANETSRTVIMSRAFFIMDFAAGGHGLGIGRAAPANGLEIGYPTVFDNDVSSLEDISAAGNLSGATLSITGDATVGGDVKAGGSTPLVPIGTILDFAAATAPAGYLVCDGSAVSRSTYAELFAVIGTTWGSGNGSTTFNVPDLRGRTAIGSGTGTASDATAHALGSSGGTETHTLTSAQSGVPAHVHRLPNSAIVYNANSTQHLATSGSATKSSVNTDLGLTTANNTAANASSAHPNMQPYAAVTKIIRAI